jgi:long-chain acyl-CoA synthetase
LNSNDFLQKARVDVAQDIAIAHPFIHLTRWAETTPDAMLFSDGMNSLSYADTLAFARTMAAKMRALGVNSGDRIALELATGLQIVFTFAAMHEGAATATFNPASHLQVDWLFTSERSDAPNARNVVFVDAGFLNAPAATDVTDLRLRGFASSDDLCRIAYSSGTTGSPKAVALTLDMVHHRAQAAHELVLLGTPFMCLLDLGTASGFHTLMAAVMSGGMYLNPGDARHNHRLVRLFGVTAIKASPIQIAQLLDVARRSDQPVESLVNIYSAGSVVPVALRKTVRDESTARLFNLFGSTEVGRAAERELDDDDLSFAGFVVEGTDLEIVDEHNHPQPFGQQGTVRYRRAHMATSYLDDDEATRHSFRDGWFYTGDEGKLESDGRLFLTGRISDVINLGGIKVQPRVAEDLALTFTGIVDAAGFGFTGTGGVEQFALAVVVQPGESMNASELALALSSQLGPLAPSSIFAVPSIPRNNAGKVDRAELSRVYAAAIASA